jgi:glutamate/tyrosine decarboxylase-like PLP-dependent enzyme
MPAYEAVLERVKNAFPSPVSNKFHDSYFVFSIMKALDRVDDMKSQRPYLGERREMSYGRAQDRRVPSTLGEMEESIAEVVRYLEGLMIWGHPNCQENVVPPTTIPSIVGNLIASIYNPNMIWDEYCHRVAEAEVEATAMVADMLGYDPKNAGGLFTFGGTGTNLYGARIGLEKAVPGSMRHGIRGPVKLVTSERSHYSRLNVAGWLGIGTENVAAVSADANNEMLLPALEETLDRLLTDGERIACILSTQGTTDAFGVDDLEKVLEIRDRMKAKHGLDYTPHVHADSVIGWIWSVFDDYDFDGNPLEFSAETLQRIRQVLPRIGAIAGADSCGVDFHKMGYAPYPDSLFLVRDRRDLSLLSRHAEAMPYLYQYGAYKPGIYSLETSRSGGAALAALANLLFLGKEGYRVLIGHVLEMMGQLRSRLHRFGWVRILNAGNHGPVTIFRVYPFGRRADEAWAEETSGPGAAAALARNNAFNRRVFEEVHAEALEGRGVALSLTTGYEVPGADGQPQHLTAMKSFIMSPFTDSRAVQTVAEEVLEAVVRHSARMDYEGEHSTGWES